MRVAVVTMTGCDDGKFDPSIPHDHRGPAKDSETGAAQQHARRSKLAFPMAASLEMPGMGEKATTPKCFREGLPADTKIEHTGGANLAN